MPHLLHSPFFMTSVYKVAVDKVTSVMGRPKKMSDPFDPCLLSRLHPVS